MNQKRIVMKFGGASLSDPYKIMHAAQLISESARSNQVVVVASAVQGVTDRLFDVARLLRGNRVMDASKEIAKVHMFHMLFSQALPYSNDENRQIDEELLKRLTNEIRASLSAAEFYNTNWNDVVALGEKYSAQLLANALRIYETKSVYIDPRTMILTDNDTLNARPNMETTQHSIKEFLVPFVDHAYTPVIPGFFGMNVDGQTTLMGRGGSDLTATVIARCVGADELVLWKNVDGIYSEDPHKNPEAKLHSHLSFAEADQLAKGGAKILHPDAMEPLRGSRIVVRVKNVAHPEREGTMLSHEGMRRSKEY